MAQIKLNLKFPPTAPIYVNAVIASPISDHLVQLDLGFVDLQNLFDELPDQNIQDGHVFEAKSVSRILLDSDRTKQLIEMLQEALNIQNQRKSG
jgi:hypothetical protein